MKKYVAAILATVLSVSMLALTSCAGKGGDNEPSSQPDSTASVEPSSQDISSMPPSSELSSLEPSSEPSSSQAVSDESYPDYSYYDDEAASIFNDYMRDQMHSSLSGEERIKDFRITYLEVRNANDSGFQFYVEYDILPDDPDQFLLAGNGDEGAGGWYVDLGRYITAEKMGDSFIISSISMSPSF